MSDVSAPSPSITAVRRIVEFFPCAKVISTSPPGEQREWLKIRIQLEHALARRVVRILGGSFNGNNPSRRRPNRFLPVSPPPALNGGPQDFLSWVIDERTELAPAARRRRPDLAALRRCLAAIPGTTVVATSDSSPRWWIRLEFAQRSRHYWNLIQELGHVLNYISINERLPTEFIPLDAPAADRPTWVVRTLDNDVDPTWIARTIDERLSPAVAPRQPRTPRR